MDLPEAEPLYYVVKQHIGCADVSDQMLEQMDVGDAKGWMTYFVTPLGCNGSFFFSNYRPFQYTTVLAFLCDKMGILFKHGSH